MRTCALLLAVLVSGSFATSASAATLVFGLDFEFSGPMRFEGLESADMMKGLPYARSTLDARPEEGEAHRAESRSGSKGLLSGRDPCGVTDHP